MSIPRKTIAATAAVAALAAGGVAIGAGTATQIAVEPVATLKAGDTAPFDAPGVRAIRRGKQIPSGYALVGWKVTTTRGAADAGAAVHFRCPDGKRLRTFGVMGRGAPAGIDRPYVGHRSAWVRSYPGAKGTAVSGTTYAVCR